MRPLKTDTPAKEKILKVASDLFFRQGYHQTGTNQIIDEAGVSKATFYAHFPSKEDLAVAYVRHHAEETMEIIGGRLKTIRNPYRRYLNLFQSVQEHVVQTEFRGCSFANIAREFPGRDSRIRAEVEAFENQYRAMLGQVVKELFASDPERYAQLDLSAQEVADRYYLLLEGAINVSANFYDEWPFRAAAKAVRDLVKA